MSVRAHKLYIIDLSCGRRDHVLDDDGDTHSQTWTHWEEIIHIVAPNKEMARLWIDQKLAGYELRNVELAISEKPLSAILYNFTY